MVAVWIILGFLVGVIFNTIWALVLGAKCTGCSVTEFLTYCDAVTSAKSEKNITHQPVSMDIVYEDYAETLTIE